MCGRNWQMERTKFVLTQRNNDTFSGDVQNKGKNPSLQEKKSTNIQTDILKVLSEAHFFCRMASDREEKKAKLELLEQTRNCKTNIARGTLVHF